MIDITEASKPAKATRKLLEKDIQKQCVEWARARGYWARKFSSMTQISVPDYLFAKAPGKKFAVEFKAPGKTSTPAQRDEQMAMSKAGWYVLECDDVDHFKKLVLVYESLC